MYIGRFLIAAPGWAAYRVSSRSFPHRKIIDRDDALAVVPTREAEPTDNPYVSYHCLRTGDGTATIGNGSHVDPIAEKVELGYPARDALVTGLHAMDFEKDDYDTPRIAAVLDAETTYVGIVRRDALIANAVDEPTLVATYEHNEPMTVQESWVDAKGAARGVFDMDYDHPVCAAGVALEDDGVETGIYNGPDRE